jgi:hypothetical protein
MAAPQRRFRVVVEPDRDGLRGVLMLEEAKGIGRAKRVRPRLGKTHVNLGAARFSNWTWTSVWTTTGHHPNAVDLIDHEEGDPAVSHSSALLPAGLGPSCGVGDQCR